MVTIWFMYYVIHVGLLVFRHKSKFPNEPSSRPGTHPIEETERPFAECTLVSSHGSTERKEQGPEVRVAGAVVRVIQLLPIFFFFFLVVPSCAPASPYERPKFRHRTCLAMVSPSKQPLARRLCWEGFLPGSVKMFPSYPICRRGTSSPPHLSSHSSSLRLVCHSLNFALFRFRSGSKSWSLVTLRSVGPDVFANDVLGL